MWRVELFRLNYDRAETEAIREVLESQWITMGQKTMDFESAFARFLGYGAQCCAVANCTAALHMALLALGVAAGDEVIVPALTFVADINVVRMVNARPVLADCASDTNWNMSPADLERKIGKKTKAVIVVHYAGYAADMDAILDICRRKRIELIEDCAHAPGADYRGKPLGTFGTISCWSFFSNKNISVGEGGMFATADEKLDRRARLLRSHGMSHDTLDRFLGRATSYDVEIPGLNYRIDEIRAAVGLVQLAKLAEANKQRELMVREYYKRLADASSVVLPFWDFNLGNSAYHIMPILLKQGVDRAKVIAHMKANGIQTSIHYPSFRKFSAFRDVELGATPIADYISEHELTLPLYPTMSKADLVLTCDALEAAIRS